ncbi:MAG: WGR domain-containing protein [Myxococcales bacterium]|nr:MAG: WGR domain-containing protein [Myxococcales bacterium]
MRRFEFVEGSSAKFWSADVEGAKFTVVYGKIGTAGSRKEKEFPSPEAAFKEYEKKVAEKTREGYVEVAGDGVVPVAPPPAEGAPAKADRREKKGPELKPRVAAGEASAASVARAVAALGELQTELASKRSWRRKLAARRAQRALGRLGGLDPASVPELSAAFDAVLARTGRGKEALSLGRALDLLWAVDVAAHGRALSHWRTLEPLARPVALMSKLGEQFPEPELAFRLGSLMLDRPGRGQSGNEAAWARRWREVVPVLQAQLTQQGTTLKKFLQGIDTAGDPPLAARINRMKEA